MDERGAVDGKLAFLRRKWNRPPNLGAGALSGLDDGLGRLVDDFVVVGTNLDTNLHAFAFCFFLDSSHNNVRKEREEGQFALPLSLIIT